MEQRSEIFVSSNEHTYPDRFSATFQNDRIYEIRSRHPNFTDKIIYETQLLDNTLQGATANILQCSALNLRYSNAEYPVPVWLNRRHIHKLDTKLNCTIGNITGWIKSTPYILVKNSLIALTHLERQEVLVRQFYKTLTHQYLSIP